MTKRGSPRHSGADFPISARRPTRFRTSPMKKNVVLLRDRVLSQTELTARRTIMLESYAKVIGIEALTMINMVNKQILPAVSAYTGELFAHG